MERTPLTLLAGADADDLTQLRSSLRRTAFLIDDPALVEAVEVGPECVCCRPRGGFTVALLELLKRRARGETDEFDRVVFAAASTDAQRALAEVTASPIASAACRIAALTIVGQADAETAELADHLIGRDQLAGAFWLDSPPLAAVCDDATLTDPAAIRSVDDQAIERILIAWDEGQPLATVGQWLQTLIDRFGARLLRLSGEIDMPEGRFAVQAVGHSLANPAPIEQDSRTGSRLICVTRGLEPNDLRPEWPVGAARCASPALTPPRSLD